MLGKKGQIHFDIWQNQYIIVKLNKIKLKKKKVEGWDFSSLKASERLVMDTWLCLFNSFNIYSLSSIFRFL